MSSPDATATLEQQLAKARKTIEDGAEASKRAVSAHRRVLSAQKQALAELDKTCEELGIELVVEPTHRP